MRSTSSKPPYWRDDVDVNYPPHQAPPPQGGGPSPQGGGAGGGGFEGANLDGVE